ncbi:hypothetical protein Cch02nite_25900 [Catellatospora chokoriensis]|uniref:DUF4145 domain-containing protein n=2 Tax=Catellatospora chokoriensis TaxID=310353 RepID=A0A8J3JXU8_9ACTN|nr:hypothetical protein Cch02nite_25900 [Catellatospora chokoriensis]
MALANARPHDDAVLETLGVICPRCAQPSAAQVMGSMIWDSSEDFGAAPELYSLLRCEHCHGPSVVFQIGDRWVAETLWLRPSVAWPSGSRSLSLSIPEAIRNELEEARTCFNSKAYRATTVMVGRALEAFCADKGANTKPLHAALQRLAAGNVIDQRLLEWAQGLRALRNDGAHFSGDQISAEDAADALELAEALLDYVYVFTARYDAFSARRAEKGLAPAPGPNQPSP